MNKAKCTAAHRHQLTNIEIRAVQVEIGTKLNLRAIEKGRGIYISRHEISGSVTEEYMEYLEAVHLKNCNEQFDELGDIVVACILGMASLLSGEMDY